jgi:CTD small phosphatase-like protein 2
MIDGIIHRNHCLKTKKGYYLKDVRIIKNRRLEDIILVDNASYSFGNSIDNGVIIIIYHFLDSCD